LVPMPLLDMDVDELPVRIAGSVRPIGRTCPVVVRSLDRIVESGWRVPWRDRWRELRDRGEFYDAQAILWVGQASGGEPDPAMVCAALTYDRCCSPSEDPLLLAALRAGMPVVLWHREDGRADRREALEQVLRGRGLRELPDVVLSQRIAAGRPLARADHAGHGLVLLWDDPDRVPQDLRWTMPASEGAAS
jgi:hypothetical protein